MGLLGSWLLVSRLLQQARLFETTSLSPCPSAASAQPSLPALQQQARQMPQGPPLCPVCAAGLVSGVSQCQHCWCLVSSMACSSSPGSDSVRKAATDAGCDLQISDNPLCTTAQGLANLEARLRKELPLFCWLNGASLSVLPPEQVQVWPNMRLQQAGLCMVSCMV